MNEMNELNGELRGINGGDNRDDKMKGWMNRWIEMKWMDKMNEWMNRWIEMKWMDKMNE